jgi:hypothetical protein
MLDGIFRLITVILSHEPYKTDCPFLVFCVDIDWQ